MRLLLQQQSMRIVTTVSRDCLDIKDHINALQEEAQRRLTTTGNPGAQFGSERHCKSLIARAKDLESATIHHWKVPLGNPMPKRERKLQDFEGATP
jgi:hypothetical protein